MSYSNGLLQRNNVIGNGRDGKDGADGIGFKLTTSGEYDLQNKILFNVKTQNDVPDDSPYGTRKKIRQVYTSI